jgi:hypothetical protein
MKLSCSQCDRTFVSAHALAGHQRMHGLSQGNTKKTRCCCIFTRHETAVQYLEQYQKNLCPCTQCGRLFKPSSDRRSFCSRSCATTYTNRQRGPRSQITREKISKTIKGKNKSNAMTQIGYKESKESKNDTIPSAESRKKVWGAYSQIFVCVCRHCHARFVSRKKKQYCQSHRYLYSDSNKLGYKFTFNIYHYPDLFDLSLLQKVGWFAPRGLSGKWNPDGLSRDHKVSVNESIRNNYDSYYITHPLNCELMPHHENNTKKTKSSLTYDELKKLVDDYESTYSTPSRGNAPRTLSSPSG